MEALQGLDKLVRTLGTLKDQSARRIARYGVNAGLAALAQAERAAVNAAPVSPELKKQARATIGKRLRKKEGEDWTGKAGFGVGKRSKAKRTKAAARAADKTRRGVGLSSADVHWFVLGTQERNMLVTTRGSGFFGRRQDWRNGGVGHPTGKVPPLLAGVISAAAGSAGRAMLDAAQKKVAEVLTSEIAKARH
jgi:hypothetical protein